MESNTGLISHTSGKQTYSYLYHWSVRVWGTAWHSHQLQLLKVVKTWEITIKGFFSVKFSADHSPNMKSNCSSLNTWRAVHGNSFEAKGCLQSCSIIPNFFFPDSQLAKKTILTLCFYCWSNTYRHSRESSALLHCCVVKTLQLEFGGLHGEQLNLFIVWFQLTSLRYPLLNGLINI